MVNNIEQEIKPEPRPRHWKRTIIELVVLVALLAAGYGFWKNPQILEQIKGMTMSSGAQDVAPSSIDYQAQINGLQSQVLQLQNQLQQVQANPQVAAEVDLTAVNDKLAAIEKTNLNVIDSKADVATVLGLITRMDKAENRLDKMVKVTDEGALLLTATMLVKDSAANGGSYEYEMEVLKQVAGNNKLIQDSLTTMSRFAKEGVTPQVQIIKEFKPIYARMVKEQKETFDHTWTDRLNSKLGEIVQIKRVNQDAPQFQANQGLEKVLQDVQVGNLTSAVEELKKLDNADLLKDDELKKWFDQALANVQFNQAVNQITAGSLAILKVNMLKTNPNN